MMVQQHIGWGFNPFFQVFFLNSGKTPIDYEKKWEFQSLFSGLLFKFEKELEKVYGKNYRFNPFFQVFFLNKE